MTRPVHVPSDVCGQRWNAAASVGVDRTSLFIILESRSGAKGSERERNPDYLNALHDIISRLAEVGGRILRVEVASAPAMRLEANERVLDLGYPIRLNPRTNVQMVRTMITETQRRTARTSRGEQAVGGNNNKRILIRVQINEEIRDVSSLAALLERPEQ